MTEHELRIKIASILQSRAFENAPLRDVELGYITTLDIADALIAEGIGDVKEIRQELKVQEAVANQYRIYFEEQKYWKEVAERALRNRARKYVDLQGYPAWDIAALADEIVVPDDLKQAEKELAEEGER